MYAYNTHIYVHGMHIFTTNSHTYTYMHKLACIKINTYEIISMLYVTIDCEWLGTNSAYTHIRMSQSADLRGVAVSLMD